MSSTAPGVVELLPGTWRIDSARSELSFSVRALKLLTFRGRLTRITGEIKVGTTPESSTVSATIDLSSVKTSLKARDKAIRSKKLLDVEKNPTATYRSTGVRPDPGTAGGYLLEGELTFLGTTRPVPLRLRAEADSAGGPTFVADGLLVRHDFGFVLNEGPKFMDKALAATVSLQLRISGATA